jgi:nucleoside-diphosphate-sugar epimerase
MKILITGVNGFIGSSLYRALSKQGYNVIGVGRKELNLLDKTAVSNFFDINHFDFVIHTAVVGGKRGDEDSPKVLDQNLRMFMNLISFKHCFRFLFNFASGAEYDRSEDINASRNDLDKSFPEDSYGLSKNLISRLLRQYSWAYNFRIYGCFSETELPQRFIRNNVTNYISKKPFELHENKLFDFFYVNDLVEVMLFYVYTLGETNKPLPKTVELTYENKVDLYYVLEVINKLSSYEVEVQWTGIMGKDYTGDSSELSKLPIRLTGLEQGIQNVYEYLLKG